ncbi:MAG TPA: protease modulator HflC [Candidatus Aquilonibacter sp.]|nr:protease modulator HflC [Candidatus Aquilonibacter sp.]
MKKRNVLTFIVGAVLVVIFLLLLFVFQVRQSETAVVTTFGRISGPPREPGLHFKWPWPIQEVYKYDDRVQNFQDKFEETLTADQNDLITSVYVGWRISDAGDFLRRFPGDPSISIPNAQEQLESMLRSANIAVVGQHPLSDFVNADPKQLKFDEIENQIEQAVRAELSTNDWGVSLDFLGLKKIELPESVTETVFDRMKSEREEIIKRYQSEGDSEAQKIRSAADRQANETIAQAEGEAERIRAEGEAEAAKTLPIFQENPQLAIYLDRLTALQEVLTNKTTLILDDRTPPFDLFSHLPTNSPSSNP